MVGTLLRLLHCCCSSSPELSQPSSPSTTDHSRRSSPPSRFHSHPLRIWVSGVRVWQVVVLLSLPPSQPPTPPSPPSSLLAVASPPSRSTRFRGLGFVDEGEGRRRGAVKGGKIAGSGVLGFKSPGKRPPLLLLVFFSPLLLLLISILN